MYTAKSLKQILEFESSIGLTRGDRGEFESGPFRKDAISCLSYEEEARILAEKAAASVPKDRSQER